MNPPPFLIEAEHCSVCGRNTPNEDYALFERDVGMCVADGIGGAPMGDAIARLACHVAISVLRSGGSAYEAVLDADAQVKRFASTVDSPTSGASLLVARLNGDTLEASWAGDTALFMLGGTADEPSLISNLQNEQPGSEIPLCGNLPVHPGRLSKRVSDGDTFILCTDGAWRSIDSQTIGRLIQRGIPPREMAARLVLGHQSDDDSTALVARIHKGTQTPTTV